MRFDIQPITRFTGIELADIQAVEVTRWREMLTWDFSPSARLVAAAIDQRLLGGGVLLSGGRPVGYCYYVRDESRAAVGSFFYLADAVDPAAATSLITATLNELIHDRHILRIEAQLPVSDRDITLSAFQHLSFAAHPRLFMTRAVDARRDGVVEAHGDHTLRPWTPDDLDSSAAILTEACQGEADRVIHVQYASREGCREFLEDLLRHPGCGQFDPALSLAAIDRASGRLCGFILGSRISPGNAHVPQIAVHPTVWGRGIGRALMRAFLAHTVTSGYTAASLNVTEANARAVTLYRNLGLREAHRFNAYVFQR